MFAGIGKKRGIYHETFAFENAHIYNTTRPEPPLNLSRLAVLSLDRRQQALGHLSRVLRHERVQQHDGGHGLDDGDGAGHDARVVTALGGQDALLGTVVGGRRLVPADGGGRLEGNAEVDGRAVGDAALDAARVVGLGGQFGPRDAHALGVGGEVGLGRLDEGVVVLRAGDLAAAEARADLEALGGGDAEHGVGELGLELVEAGFAEGRGGVADDAGDGAADAVLALLELADEVNHLVVGLFVRAADGEVLVDGVAVDGVEQREEAGVRRRGRVLRRRREEVAVADAGREGGDLGAVGFAEVLLGEGAGGDASDGLAGGGAAAAGRRLDAVLLEVGPVGVGGTGEHVHGRVAVVLGALVLILDEHADRGAKGDAELGAALDDDAVLFVSRCRNGALAGAAAVQLGLDVGLGKGHAGRDAIDDDTDRFAVGLAVAAQGGELC
ncbi:hypothetical protein CTA2_11079 [Colletotrichum tanaceti]|nr:hypothetical protein CTA2_11079 [Colletotrichum tanaceti]